MFTFVKSIQTPSSFVARRVLFAYAAKQENLCILYRLATRETSSVSKSLEDISPPYLSNQIKYSSDSYLERDFHEDDDYERYSQMNPRNITKAAAAMTSGQDEVTYDEDYDQFYSHMTPSSMQSQDYEQLECLEMIHHEDVEPSEGLRINDMAVNISEDCTADMESLSYNVERLEDSEYVELEEDWEIMHQSAQEGKSIHIELCDNIDDVNDVVQ